jgi:hypothetical protein
MLSKSPSFPRSSGSRHDNPRDERVFLSLYNVELPSASNPSQVSNTDWDGWEYIDLRLSKASN